MSKTSFSYQGLCFVYNEEGVVNTDDKDVVINTETWHLPDKIEAWTTKKVKIKILEQSFELAIKKHDKRNHTLVNEVKRKFEITHSIVKKSNSGVRQWSHPFNDTIAWFVG